MVMVARPAVSKTNLLTLLAALLLASPLAAQQVGDLDGPLQLQIVGPGLSRMPLAVPTLKRLGGTESEAAADYVSLLSRDLEMSGLFRVIDSAAYIDDPQTSGIRLEEINFDNWLTVGARGLVRGTYEVDSTGLTVEVRFFDVPGRSMIGGRKFSATGTDFARMAHRTADAVMEFVTGRLGPFDSRIAFVSDRGGHTRDVFVFSFDGRVQRLTRHGSVVMAPSWHPDATSLVFTSFKERRPSLYRVDLPTGEQTRLASKLGLNIGGTWSPDGKLLAVAREVAGNTDVYAIDFAKGKQWKLSEHWGIDVDPAWSNDGKRLAFCSSRSGRPQVYVMDISERRPERLTFEGTYNCSPTWSPDGTTIAYTGRTDGRFQIFTIPATGGGRRQLTFEGSNEDPTWSPDSRFIAFSSRRGGRKKLFLVDADGRWERQLTDGEGDDTSPSWSRRLD